MASMMIYKSFSDSLSIALRKYFIFHPESRNITEHGLFHYLQSNYKNWMDGWLNNLKIFNEGKLYNSLSAELRNDEHTRDSSIKYLVTVFLRTV